MPVGGLLGVQEQFHITLLVASQQLPFHYCVLVLAEQLGNWPAFQVQPNVRGLLKEAE